MQTYNHPCKHGFQPSHRSRLLAMLCKDERSTKLPIYNMLQKIYLERVVRAPEIEQFQKVRDCPVLSVCLSV